MFLSYFRMIDLSCRLPHLSGPASKELVWQLFFHPFVNDRKWQPWLFQFFSHLQTIDIFLFRKLLKFGYFLTISSEENSLNKRDIAHILLYDSELMATLAVNFLQTISTSTRQVVLWISSFAWKCILSWKIFSQSTLDFLGIFMESECHLGFPQNCLELWHKICSWMVRKFCSWILWEPMS